jgi:hypothetical protein
MEKDASKVNRRSLDDLKQLTEKLTLRDEALKASEEKHRLLVNNLKGLVSADKELIEGLRAKKYVYRETIFEKYEALLLNILRTLEE